MKYFTGLFDKLAVITVEPAVQRLPRESEAFGSSFWRENVYVSSILTFWLFCRTSDLFYRWWGIGTAYGCSNRSNKVGWEKLSWHKHRSKHRFCYMARAGTTEHLNMLFFGKIYVWRYVSPHYLLEFTTSAVDHDPNASLPCDFTWKPLNCRLNCKYCYWMKASLLFYCFMRAGILPWAWGKKHLGT